MRAWATNLLDWQEQYGVGESCAQALTQQRWSEGVRCPRCGHDHAYVINTRHSYECSKCHYQTSLTVRTLSHSTNLSLTKWFWAIYLSASDKGSISAVRLSKQIEVSWITACRILRKIRIAMRHRDSIYRLHDLIEIDDALAGGRSAEGKKTALVAIENRSKCTGFVAMQQVSAVTHETVAKFVQCHLPSSQLVCSDALASLAEIGKIQHHAARLRPPDMAGEWLPWVQYCYRQPQVIPVGHLSRCIVQLSAGVSQ